MLKGNCLAFDYLGCYILKNKEIVKFSDFDSLEISSASAEKMKLILDGDTFELDLINASLPLNGPPIPNLTPFFFSRGMSCLSISTTT